MNKHLWTKNFTILTLGSVVSMLGNAMIGFAISLYVLDITGSTFLYAMYLFFYTLPQIIAPMISGPLIDHFSKRTTVYLLDFISAGVYLFIGILSFCGFFHFGIFIVFIFIIGILNSVYRVAYSSFYPLLVSEGYYSKAYSVSSTLETVSFVMIPVSAILYSLYGLSFILIINSFTFLVAAICETKIKIETNDEKKINYNIKNYSTDMKEGLKYLLNDKGLKRLVIFAIISSIGFGVSEVITLPWFKSEYMNGEYVYMYVFGILLIGRVLGGAFLYRVRFNKNKKIYIAIISFALAAMLEGIYLYFPVKVMIIFTAIMGVCGIFSHNVRTSGIQTYVPDEKRGRFNGVLVMLTTLGTLLGELLSGTLQLYFRGPHILTFFTFLSAIAMIVLVGFGQKDVKPILNRE